ncbi:actin family [Schizothecium vesticola]|uniref:Actin-like protein ARP6 n=1 Tax=Schizothecium vesticola TaxID=314040 RepID=A0AA40EPE5_9PEZI|nr:actin family [Schizothecium vesticola]
MAGGKKSRASGPAPPSRTLVLDNGAYTIKAGFVLGDHTDEPRIIPNCLARDRHRKVYVGSELDKCKDFGEMAFRRPVEKGFIVNWEAQKEIWDREFFDDKAPQRCDPSETRLVLAEQPNALPALQLHCDQMVFEEFGFASYCRVPGHSHTTVTPILQGRPLHPAIRRLDVGGKLLTNHLTRLLSVRHFDMRNDPYLVNEMKESACYISLDFSSDLEHSWKGTRGERRPSYLAGSAGIARDYVLPDSHTRFHGAVRDYDPTIRKKGGTAAEDVLTLRNERFAVPELLFRPSDVGMRQPGLGDLVMQSLGALPVGLWPAMLANVVCVGGNVLLENFVQRLQREVLERVPDVCIVRVARPEEPVVSTWRGAARFAVHEHVERVVVTRGEYEEFGAGWVARRFAGGVGVDS